MKNFFSGALRIICLVVAVLLVLNFANVQNFLNENVLGDGTDVDSLLYEVGVTDKNKGKAESSSEDKEQEPYYDTVEVIRVIDGDTVLVSNGGVEERVRFIGVNTPESVHPDGGNTEEGEIASNYTKSILSEGMILYLMYDVGKTDTYGRTLAYIWMQPPSCPEPEESEIRTNMFQCQLLREGYAEPMAVAPNTKYSELFQRIYEENQNGTIQE